MSELPFVKTPEVNKEMCLIIIFIFIITIIFWDSYGHVHCTDGVAS